MRSQEEIRTELEKLQGWKDKLGVNHPLYYDICALEFCLNWVRGSYNQPPSSRVESGITKLQGEGRRIILPGG
jgi:hypothetical protein